MTVIQTFRSGSAMVVLINGTAHILKPSSSRYQLAGPDGFRRRYACQDGCCDRGLRQDVSDVVLLAKEAGATDVVVRTGQRGYYLSEIQGLPTRDVSGKLGNITDIWRIIDGNRE